jgi:hypothetical protein
MSTRWRRGGVVIAGWRDRTDNNAETERDAAFLNLYNGSLMLTSFEKLCRKVYPQI